MKLLDSTIDCRDSQILNANSYHKIIWQRRLMAIFTTASIAGVILFIVAVFLPDWVVIDFTNTQFEHIHIQLGILGEWRSTNVTKNKEWISHFPEPASNRFHRLGGVYLKHYYRAQAVFCLFALILMVFTNGMALYCFTHHRYMFKRLVAVLYLITAMCIVMTIEILINSVDEWNRKVAQKGIDSSWDYSAERKTGIAVKLAWANVIIYLITAVVFGFSSHKQKGSRAATAEFEVEDRPIHVGR